MHSYLIKIFTIVTVILMMIPISFANNTKHAVWGKVLKTKDLHGHTYFIFFKSEGKSYAYPLSATSSIEKKKLDSLTGKYARIYGQEKFEKIELEGTKHILTFEVNDAQELTLADLNQNLDVYQPRIDVELIAKRQLKSDQALREGISDKAINTAIFIGGAILASEVLGVLISQ